MVLDQFIAAQLRKPTGFIGRFIILPFLNRRNIELNTKILEMLALRPDDEVLEIGFGGGYLIEHMMQQLPHGRIAGIDFSADAVQKGMKRFERPIKNTRLELRQADVEAIPYEANTFSKACTVNTIYFWQDPRKALSEIKRILREGGVLAIGFSPKSVLEKMEIAKHGFTMYEPEEVKSLLEATGYRDVHLTMSLRQLGDCWVATGRK